MMSKDIACVFDLDRTLYSQSSLAIENMRKIVIKTIACNYSISIDKAINI